MIYYITKKKKFIQNTKYTRFIFPRKINYDDELMIHLIILVICDKNYY